MKTIIKLLADSIKENEKFLQEIKDDKTARFYTSDLKKQTKEEFIAYQNGVNKGFYLALKLCLSRGKK